MTPSRTTNTKFLVAMAAALIALGFSIVAGQISAEETTTSHDPVVIQLRVWQRVTDSEELWISAREAGGRWDTFGTVPLQLSDRGVSAGAPELDLYGTDRSYYISYRVQLAGIGLRVWQHYSDLDSIFVEACASPCEAPGRTQGIRGWRPLGKTPLPLNDGHSPRGYYRYGNLKLAVPKANPGLQSDRQHLLALRDVLEGGATELDWDIGTATRDWEGITVEGSPTRVIGLNLSNRGLAGELWGYIGDLTQLQELRLNHNDLHGLLPSKLRALSKLAVLTLASNDFSGSPPCGLPSTLEHDFSESENASCSPTRHIGPGSLVPGMYFEFHDGRYAIFVFFDIPPGRAVGIRGVLEPYRDSHQSIVGLDPKGRTFYDIHNEDVWLFIWLDRRPMYEIMRSHYSGCIFDCLDQPSNSAFLEQLAASLWWKDVEG